MPWPLTSLCVFFSDAFLPFLSLICHTHSIRRLEASSPAAAIQYLPSRTHLESVLRRPANCEEIHCILQSKKLSWSGSYGSGSLTDTEKKNPKYKGWLRPEI